MKNIREENARGTPIGEKKWRRLTLPSQLRTQLIARGLKIGKRKPEIATHAVEPPKNGQDGPVQREANISPVRDVTRLVMPAVSQ